VFSSRQTGRHERKPPPSVPFFFSQQKEFSQVGNRFSPWHIRGLLPPFAPPPAMVAPPTRIPTLLFFSPLARDPPFLFFARKQTHCGHLSRGAAFSSYRHHESGGPPPPFFLLMPGQSIDAVLFGLGGPTSFLPRTPMTAPS